MALFLTEKDVESLLTVPDAFSVLEGPIREQGEGAASTRPRQISRMPEASVSVLQGAIPSLQSMGFKTYTVSPEGVRFWVMLFGGNGEMDAIIEAETLGMIRTGATAGIATKHLSRKESSTVGILGTGYQAPALLEAVCQARKIEKILAWSPTRENVLKFCERMSRKLGVPVEPADSPKAAVQAVDVVVTITSAKDPVLQGDWLREGTHINMVGAMKPAYREADDRTIDRANLLVADDWRQTQEESGEFRKAAEEGRLDWARVKELSAIVAGKVAGRTAASDITLFKSLGIGLWDVAVARRIYQLAVERKLGVNLPITQKPKVLGGGRSPDRMKP
jgi:alanine dehydrogenase